MSQSKAMDFRTFVQRLGLDPGQTSLGDHPTLNPRLEGVAAIDQAQGNQVTFLEAGTFAPWLSRTAAGAIILPSQPDRWRVAAAQRSVAWVVTPHPRLLFAQALGLFYQPWQPEAVIHPTAVIDPTVHLGKGVAVGAHVVLQRDCRVGDGVIFHPNVVVYPDVEIGDRTVLHANCVIHERSILEPGCVIHSGAVIGAEGFGFVPTATGWVKMPQSGRVVLEEGVEVGCNSTIDRPAVGETRVGRGTKIDNLVQVGHGTQIGHHCILVSQVGLAGAVKMGDRVVVAGQAGVSEKIQIGTGAVITAGAGVIQDVAAGETVSGFPAMPHKLWLRTSLLIRRLPQLLNPRGA